MAKVLQWLEYCLAWCRWLADWVNYGIKCAEKIVGAFRNLVDTWPARPTIPVPPKPSGTETSNTQGP